MGLYHDYRPKSFKEVVGQDAAVAVLQGLLKSEKFPHALLLTGASGVGKTTLARIVAGVLGCVGKDLQEINSADFRGIDKAREIDRKHTMSPAFGAVRVYILDEFHRQTRDSQEAMLKMLEECPDHCYFMLATTEPDKLIKAIITRCTEVNLQPVSTAELWLLLDRVASEEKEKLDGKIRDKIAEVADGSARKALVLLEEVFALPDGQSPLEYLEKQNLKAKSIDLCRALMKPGTPWGHIAQVLKDIEGEEPESVRHHVLAYATTALLSGNPNAARLIGCFQFNFFDSKRAGLVYACYRMAQGGK